MYQWFEGDDGCKSGKRTVAGTQEGKQAETRRKQGKDSVAMLAKMSKMMV